MPRIPENAKNPLRSEWRRDPEQLRDAGHLVSSRGLSRQIAARQEKTRRPRSLAAPSLAGARRSGRLLKAVARRRALGCRKLPALANSPKSLYSASAEPSATGE